ncbi:MAG: hypothetical protein Udaeo_14190 [Candidatus Udaeobacter sp.]|nr:MAG: hypothetical protein Udaeo_14190 [Candidatus Udaeobacter sp.]
MCCYSGGCGPEAVSNAIARKVFQPLHDAVIRVYDEAGNVIETQEAAGEAGLGAITAAQQRPGFRSAFALTMRYGNSECGMGFGGWRGLRCAMNRQKNGADRAALASPGALFRQCGSRCGSQLAGVVLAMRPSGL